MKRKRNSKVISLLLAVMMIVTSLPFAGISAFAATSGDFEYERLNDGTAKITDYTGDAQTLKIPAALGGYTVTSIGDYVFENCGGLTSVTIPSGITSIGYAAFRSCYGLTSITVDENNSVYSSQDGVLFNKEKAELIQYPIGSEITSYSVPNGVTKIDDYAFAYCESLTGLTIPDGVASIGVDAFSGTGYYNDASNWKNGVLYIGNYLIAAKSDELPAEYSVNEGAVTVADYAFKDCAGLTGIKIPNSVKNIGNYAFQGCESLASVTIPDSVTSIGEYAFASCGSLTNVNLGKGVTNIGNGAFEGCSNISVTVSGDLKTNGSLFKHQNIENITFAQGVTAIPAEICKYCGSLRSLTIPNSVKSIGNYAFEYCDSLESVTIPDSVTSIGNNAFAWCEGLTSVDLGKGVTSIGNGAFDGCSGLTSITIPSSVTSIGDYAFEYCDGLESVTIPDSVTSIGKGVFYDCESLISVTIPDCVTSVGEYAFASCDSLTSVDLGKSIKNIGEYAFAWCVGLTSITIPSSAKRIGDWAFKDSALETIYGYENSYAQIYAKEKGYEFAALGSIEIGALGDVNGDGKINALDVLIVKRYIAKYADAEFEYDMFIRADVNGDGKVDAIDALAIMQKIAKLIGSFDEIGKK